MANDIDSYLSELQAALAGADRALVQDALFDAEEYLQAEMAAGSGFSQALERYGTPEEVAAAYVGSASGVDASAATPHTPAAAPQTGAPPTGSVRPGEPYGPRGPLGPGVPGEPGGPSAPARSAGVQAPVGPLPVGVRTGRAAAETPVAPPSAWQQVFGVFIDPQVYKALLYMILSLATGIAYFTIVVTGLSTAGGLLVLIIGIPLLLLVLGIVRAMALFEGRIVELLLGTRMPRRPRAEPPNAGFIERIWFWVKDGRTWASMAYMILMLPLGIVYFTIAVTGLAIGVGLITTPLWAWLSGLNFVYEGVTYGWWFPVWAIPLAVVAGFVALLAWLHVVRWMGRGHAAFAKALLVRLSK